MILAAGAGRRFGGIKQLALIDGEPMLKRVVESLAIPELADCSVVIGAHHDQVRKVLEGTRAQIVTNPSWETGMASTIKVGLVRVEALLPSIDAVIIALADQPHISGAYIRRMCALCQEEPERIIASQYDTVRGVPVLFPRDSWPHLFALSGDRGARRLLQDLDPARILELPCPDAAIDIDTKADLHDL